MFDQEAEGKRVCNDVGKTSINQYLIEFVDAGSLVYLVASSEESHRFNRGRNLSTGQRSALVHFREEGLAWQLGPGYQESVRLTVPGEASRI